MPPSFPPGAGTEQWLSQVAGMEDVGWVIPYYYDAEEMNETFALILSWEQSLVAGHVAFPTGKWNSSEPLAIREEPIVDRDSLWEGTVSFKGSDTETVKELLVRLNKSLKQMMGTDVIPYCLSHQYNAVKKAQKKCSCENLESSTVELQTVDDLPYQRLTCMQCKTIHGVHCKGKTETIETVLDANWILTDPFEAIHEIDRGDDYLIYSSGDSKGRVETAIDVLSTLGRTSGPRYSEYRPQSHETLVYVKDGDAVGYLTWNYFFGHDVLRQLYVLPDARRQGVAETLIRTWSSEHRHHLTYYADEPNKDARSLFKKISHWDNDGTPLVREWFSIFPQSVSFADKASLSTDL